MDARELLAEYGPRYFERDLALDEGNLAVDNQDLVALDWAESLNQALMRRLNTPLGAIASSVRGVEGVLVVNATYGNPAFKYLSEPLNSRLVLRMREGVLACLQQEVRIEVIDLNAFIDVNNGAPILMLNLTYTVAGGGRTQTLSIGADQSARLFIEVVG